LLPKQAHYQAVLHPDVLYYFIPFYENMQQKKRIFIKKLK